MTAVILKMREKTVLLLTAIERIHRKNDILKFFNFHLALG